MNIKLLSHDFFARNTVKVAEDLIGKLLIRKTSHHTLIGIINETEAYTCEDPAAHCYNQKLTNRTRALFGPVGHAYIYLNYGLHYCLNIVAHDKNQVAGGVLIRSIVPVSGIDIMLKNRNMSELSKNLTNGPGKVGQALEITKTLYGIDLCDLKSELIVAEGQNISDNLIEITPRIGISKAQDYMWRFFVKPENFK